MENKVLSFESLAAKATKKVTQSVGANKGLDAIAEAMDAFPEKLQDDKFLTAYAHSRIAARNKRLKDKEEKDRMNKFLKKAKEAEANKDKVLLYQVQARDFHYKYWELPNGTVYREILVRAGLKVTKVK